MVALTKKVVKSGNLQHATVESKLNVRVNFIQIEID